MAVYANESYRFEQEVFFDGHLYQFPVNGECLIRRGSDGFTWNGVEFDANENWNPTTVDASNEFHYYDWVVPITAQDGDTFLLKIRLQDDPDTESGGNMIVREPATGGGGGDTFIYPINVFDD